MRTRSAVDQAFRLSVPLLTVLGLVLGLVVGINSRADASTSAARPVAVDPARVPATAPVPPPVPEAFPVPDRYDVRPGPIERVGSTVLSQTVAFGPEADDTSLDVYWPADRTAARGGGVLLIHGGAWVFGSKTSETETALRLARQGYVAATVDYRTYPRFAPWPAAAVDVFTATAILRDRAPSYGMSPERLVAAGWSAGGQLAMLLGTVGAGSARVAAVVSWSGPSDVAQMLTEDARRYDCTPADDCNERDHLATSFTGVMGCPPDACPDRYAAASPRRQVGPDDVPMLLATSADELIATSQTARMATSLEAVGLPAETLVLSGSRHGFDLRPSTRSAFASWLDRYATAPRS